MFGIGAILAMCARFSWWIEINMISSLLFGEYPYPTEEDC